METRTPVGLVEEASTTDFGTTMARLVAVIEEAGMAVFARIDHAGAAREAGLTMPPTVVLLYGNPKGGTPIMLATPRVALDLPLRVLLREDDDGKVLLSFHPIGPSLREAGVPDQLVTRLESSQKVVLHALPS